MPIYKQTTEITKIDDVWANIDRDIVEVYFGDKNIFTVWGEYDSSLPITINANGDALIDYRIYGADGGVGEPTESREPAGYKLPMTVIDNLAQPLSQWINGYVRSTDGVIMPSGFSEEKVSDFIKVKSNTKYVFGIEGGAFPKGTAGAWVGIGMYRDDQTFINRYTYTKTSPYTFLTLEGTKYVRLSYRSYGELLEPRLSENSFSIPVYIGENQLDSVEGVSDYVDKASGKIVRMIGEYTFTGDENIAVYGNYGSCWLYGGVYGIPEAISTENVITMRCDHPTFTAVYNRGITKWARADAPDNVCSFRAKFTQPVLRSTVNFMNAEECKAYLKAQYDNGTPIKISYWLKTPIEEDPPVSFPDIPTIKGETIIDYDGTPKPSQMYIKYRKQHS